MKSYTVLLLLVAAYSTAGAHPDNSVDKKPNILFMMVDDWGWANVGYHRDVTPTTDISTPNMDGLVNEGLQLDHHYVYNWCSPSRSAFLSGIQQSIFFSQKLFHKINCEKITMCYHFQYLFSKFCSYQLTYGTFNRLCMHGYTSLLSKKLSQLIQNS